MEHINKKVEEERTIWKGEGHRKRTVEEGRMRTKYSDT